MRTWKWFRLGSIFLILYIITSFCLTAFLFVITHSSGICSDFIHLNYLEGCIFTDGTIYEVPESNEAIPITAVFLSNGSPYSRGAGGCEDYYSNSNRLSVWTKLGQKKFIIRDNQLFLNNKIFPVGKEIEQENYLTFNPWSANLLILENNGQRYFCGHEEKGEMFFITGWNAERINLRKGTILLIFSTIFLSYSSVKIKSLKRALYGSKGNKKHDLNSEESWWGSAAREKEEQQQNNSGEKQSSD